MVIAPTTVVLDSNMDDTQNQTNEGGSVGGYDSAAAGLSDAGGVESLPNQTYGSTGSNPGTSGLSGTAADKAGDDLAGSQIGSTTGGVSTNPSTMTGSSNSGSSGGLAEGGNLGGGSNQH